MNTLYINLNGFLLGTKHGSANYATFIYAFSFSIWNCHSSCLFVLYLILAKTKSKRVEWSWWEKRKNDAICEDVEKKRGFWNFVIHLSQTSLREIYRDMARNMKNSWRIHSFVRVWFQTSFSAVVAFVINERR